MKPLLFVSNGHGEAAIADAIAAAVRASDPSMICDHLALVGRARSYNMSDVGPQRALPSGGLIAMGNLANIARDIGAGLIGLVLAQRAFLRRAHGRYGTVVAVGDSYAYAMARAARSPIVFVGTAKSVSVAPYGPFEERLLRGAAACFVRDEPTAERLRSHGVRADAANAIVDLFASAPETDASDALEGFAPVLVLLPGSRESAYGDARRLIEILGRLQTDRPSLGAVLSVAPGMDARRFSAQVRADGWDVADGSGPVAFVASRAGRPVLRAWTGALAPLLRHATVALGQAGTANEEAAAAGVPVVALERGAGTRSSWYRHRQRRLLGDALAVLPDDPGEAARGIDALLEDPDRRARMADAGKLRMGPPGGAQTIAARILAVVGVSSCAG
ncbi:MAG: hypothetical protein ABI431_03505 [Candidatus Tumulicola sp.]